MTDSEELHEMKEKLSAAQEMEGRGTELVSLYIPSGKSIGPYQTQMGQEHAEADNIKSDRTRKRVQSALSKVESILKQYKKTPENGLVIFSGIVNDNMETFVFDNLPRELDHSDYICTDIFVTEPLEEVITPSTSYGLLVIDRNEATIGQLIGQRIQVLQNIESGVMGKSKAGGQSAARFERVRKKQKEKFFTKVGKNVTDTFVIDNSLEIDGFLLGGTDITVDEFQKGEYVDYRIQDSIISRVNVSYGNEQGLNQLVDKSQDSLQEFEEKEAKEYMERFYDGLAENNTHVTYGKKMVEKAAESGAVKTVLLSEKLDNKTVEELSKAVDQQGGDTILVPQSFEKGNALWQTFDGVAAILRYDVSWMAEEN